jgi:hypothetical protein
LVEAHWRRLIVSSDHPSADEQVAEAIARVLSRYAVDYGSGVEVTMSHDGVEVTYVASQPMSLASALRASRGPQRTDMLGAI